VLHADATICVLSLPDLITSKSDADFCVDVPSSVKSLVKQDTIFLLNKADALGDNATNQFVACFPAGRTWMCSVKTGEGMKDFMDGFTGLLKERYELHYKRINYGFQGFANEFRLLGMTFFRMKDHLPRYS
jgi:hypothetical protein